MVRVKICAMNSVKDALKAVELGADAIGMLIGKGGAKKDSVSIETARQIAHSLPPYCSSVLLICSRNPKEISKIVRYVGASAVQLHGGQSIKEVTKVRKLLPNVKIYRAFHVIDDHVMARIKVFEPYLDAILLDSFDKRTGQVGGTGLVHDWKVSKKIVEQCKKPVILAGGLNEKNVAKAIKQVKPFAVDVQSSVTNPDKSKNYAKVKKFIQIAKKY